MLNDELLANDEFSAIYEQLTPENKRKVKIKALQLMKQEQGQKVTQKEYYYFFDCLDGVLADRYLTARELAQLFTGGADPMPERDIIRTAANYEATLYRYEFDENDNPTNEVILYDCAF